MSDASGNGVCECSIIHPISMSVCHLLYLMAIASPLVVFFESDGWAVDLLDFEEGHVSAIVAADALDAVLAAIKAAKQPAWLIGEVVKGTGVCRVL